MALQERDRTDQHPNTPDSSQEPLSRDELLAMSEAIVDKRVAKLKERPDNEQERNKEKETFLHLVEETLERHGVITKEEMRFQGHSGEASITVTGEKRTTRPVTIGTRTLQLGDSDLKAISPTKYVREKGYLRVEDPNDPDLEDGGSIYVFGQELSRRNSFVSVERSTRASTDEIKEAIVLVRTLDTILSSETSFPPSGDIPQE